MSPTSIAEVQSFFDPATSTWSYLVSAPGSEQAAVIDPVLDFDPRSGRVATTSAQKLLDAAAARRLQIAWVLETHAHADHLTGAHWLKRQLGGAARIGIGGGITQVQQIFKKVLNLPGEFATDGRQFDQLFSDGDTFMVGPLQFRVMATAGHTPDSVTYLVGDAAFIGDTLFMPDYGTARCDFPGGDAHQLYHSVRKILSLPDTTRLFLCHDYPLTERDPDCLTTPQAQRSGNVHVHDGIAEQEFVALRKARDATLSSPVLLWPSIQVNIRAGELPEAEAVGQRYLKIPLRGAET